MPDKNPLPPKAVEPAAAVAGAPGAVPVRRHPGHRGADVRDTVAEMAAKAQEISMEAGSKMAAAMKDVISAAAGLSAFAIESARDLVQYMVRRGQMTQDEADKLIQEAEESWAKKNKGKLPPPPSVVKAAKLAAEKAKPVVAAVTHFGAPAAAHKPAAKAPAKAPAKSHAKPVAKAHAKPAAKAKPHAKAHAKPAAKAKPAPKK